VRKDIFNGFALFLTWNTAEHFSVVGPGLKAFTRSFYPRALHSWFSPNWKSPALIADMMLVVGQAVLTVTDELMITEDPLFKKGIAF